MSDCTQSQNQTAAAAVAWLIARSACSQDVNFLFFNEEFYG